MTDSRARHRTVAEAAREFGPFDGRVWLNTAHQGPLPRASVAAAHEAARLKANPHRLGDEEFTAVPEKLRSLLARLLGAQPEQVVLGDSTSHGLHAIANGLNWSDGDEVIVVDGDYPATVLPWQRLAGRGVRTRAVRSAGDLLTAEELAAVLRPRTRLVAVTWVDSFTGRALDLDALGAVCRRAGVLLVVNASQALGARPLDVSTTPVDAVVCCGYKWLCGPYGTGFSWLHPDLLARLQPQQAYWLAMHAGRGLERMRDTALRNDLGVRAFDRFCPADFGDVLPFSASVQLLLDTGLDAIAAHDQRLVDRLISGLDRDRFRLVSPAEGPSRSTLVVVGDTVGSTEGLHQRLSEVGVDVAYREGNLRLSVHLFTREDDISRALETLHRYRSPSS